MEETKTVRKFNTPTFEEFIDMSRNKFPAKSKDEIIEVLEKNILKYEKRYNMSSMEFIKRFDSGEVEERDDFPGHELFRWRSDYRSLLRLKNKDAKQ
ncbi:MAG: hypothetical protein ACE5IW_03615 [bacterium]